MTHKLQCECGEVLPPFATVCPACLGSNLLPVTSHDPLPELTYEQREIERMMRLNRGVEAE